MMVGQLMVVVTSLGWHQIAVWRTVPGVVRGI